MKNNYYRSALFFAACSFALFLSNSGGPMATSGIDRTGSPLSGGQICSACHSGASFTTTTSIELVDVAGTPQLNYLPEQTYTVRVRVNFANGTPQRFGFQSVVLLDSDDSQAGFIGNQSSNARITNANNRDYIEQLSSSTADLFTYQWTAPAAGAGPVTIYAAGLAADGNGSTGGDAAASASLNLSEEGATNINANEAKQELRVYPNPLVQYTNVELPQGSYSLSVYNSLGQEVYQAQLRNWAGGEYQLNLGQLPQGLYSLLCRQGSETVYQKQLIKQ